ncbi:MAG: CotH kinase family protein [Oscillospiraceae bacterium]|nr:CotH kinase family protein [Oscillospiraceae bacterium]
MMKIIRFLGIVCLISLMSMSGCDKENADFRTEDDTKPAEITEQEEVSEPVRKPASVTYDETISAPVFSRETGFYSDAFDLELSVSGGGEIRYTTDGSIPSEDSELYSESIRIEKISGYPNKLAGITEVGPAGEQYAPDKAVDKGTVIRAAVFRDGKSGPVVTNSYFTGINQKEDYNSLPVISLTTDAYNLFDYENGIYVLGKTYDEWKNTAEAMEAEDWEWKGNFTQKGREWERPVHMELIEPDGNVGLEQDLGMRIMGKASRTYNQKSFRMYAREEYGKNKVEYPLIPGLKKENGDGELTKFRTFLLRNGGNDCSYTKLRDPFVQTMVSGKSFATQGSRPAVVFINGEYWGLYAVQEDYSDNSVQYNFGVSKDDVIIVKAGNIEEGEDADISYLEELNTLMTGELSDETKYEKLCSIADIQSFADFFSTVIYTANNDGMKNNGGNWRIWRSRSVTDEPYHDGKWRFLLYDTEFSLGLYNEGDNFSENSLAKAYDTDWFASLMKNENFRKLFSESLKDTAERFRPENAFPVLDELAAQYGPAAPDSFQRFGPSYLLMMSGNKNITEHLEQYYSNGIDDIKKFLTERYQYWPAMLEDIS